MPRQDPRESLPTTTCSAAQATPLPAVACDAAERELWLHAWACVYSFRAPTVETVWRNTLLRA